MDKPWFWIVFAVLAVAVAADGTWVYDAVVVVIAGVFGLALLAGFLRLVKWIAP